MSDEVRFTPGPFTPRAFELLVGLHVLPTKTYYQAHRAEFKAEVEKPFQELFLAAGRRLPLEMNVGLETERGLFSRILKNDYGQGGAWDHYWGAFYPRGGRRIGGPQLLASLNHEGLMCAFYVSGAGKEQRARLRRNGEKHAGQVRELLFAPTEGQAEKLAGYLCDPAATDYFLEWARLSDQQVLASADDDLTGWIARNLGQLFPLALLALFDEPITGG